MILGIIGPEDSSMKIKECINKLNLGLKINLYIREKVHQAIEVMEICDKECDAFIFTGCGVYEAVNEKFELNKPHSFVSRGGTSITKALWEVKNSGIEYDKISLDVVEQEELVDTLTELDIDLDRVYSKPFSSDCHEDEYVKWHIDLYENKKTDIMLTGFGGVYNELKNLGYPVYRLQATVPAIKSSYEKLNSSYKLKKAKNSQIAVEVLRLIDYGDEKEKYYSDMLKMAEIDKKVIEYVRELQGSIFKFGRDEYVVFAHKGAVENIDNYSILFDLKKDIKSMGFVLCIGIGIGLTAYQAEAHAYKSIKRCEDSSEKEIFLIDEKENIKGPLKSKNQLSYSLASADKNILLISEKTGLSCESISKIMSLNKTRQSNVYDSKEFADYLNISERSARRILNKIVSANYGRIYAKESSNGVGRPRHLIEISF
ncbi:MAG: transcriptional regulator [Clostridioides difficile]|nr:transcriptional regulator [Clostridioides sp.]MBS5787005.1 transcriptional regulator [Clostridioides difficile]